MVNDGKASLTRIKKNTSLLKLLIKLLYKKEELDAKDAEFLYSVALVLIDVYEENSEKSLYIEYAYFIIAKTSFKTNDFRALYDFAVNYGYYPIARKIMELELITDIRFNHILTEAAIDEFSDGSKTLTLEQSNIFKEILNNQNGDATSFIAPTSYGKSEIIFSHIDLNDVNKIGIIVPSKALIDQVSRDARRKVFNRKIIIHDQVFNPEKDQRILAIVTQERALRLMERGLIFDSLYVDEAHELLTFDFKRYQDNRSLLLARLIELNKLKNQNTKVIYLSPVVKSSENLKLKNLEQSITEHKIKNDLKLLDIKFLSENGTLSVYDRFINEMIKIEHYDNYTEYITQNLKIKNLHFLYKPRNIEEYAEELYEMLPTRKYSAEIVDLIEELKDYVHPKFKMAKYLEKGIIYLHAKLPTVLKNYLLKNVKENPEINHFVANSVVLAGMNLPIDNLFYISGFSNKRDLYNLIGRVNRLNEIFSIKNKKTIKNLYPCSFS